MTNYTNPIPPGDDPANYGDIEKVEFLKQLVTDRRDKGIAIPRLVRAINKAGYPITVSEYKHIERYPLEAVPHINAWLLEYAYRVLNSTRVQNSVQGKRTDHAMTVIADVRVYSGLEYHHMAEKLNSVGVQITEAEYRAAEQGMTKHVSFEVIAESARILGISPERLFE